MKTFWRFGKTDNLQHATPTDSKYVRAVCGAWHPNGGKPWSDGWTDAGKDCVFPKCPKCEAAIQAREKL